jgi:hypothetical protein
MKTKNTLLAWHRIGVLWFLASSPDVAVAACNAAADACDFGAEEDGGIVVVNGVGVLWVLANTTNAERKPQLPWKWSAR